MSEKSNEKGPHYTAFAEIYDRVMHQVDYPTWSRHVIRLAKKYKFKGKKWLDLACGTGSTSLELTELGYTMTGVDLSQQMLDGANDKAAVRGVKIPFVQSPMQSLGDAGLPRDFDVVICLYDSLNYLLRVEDVKACFAGVCKHLKPGGGYIFDVTTEYNLLHNFAGYTFAENFEHSSYIWENQYNIKSKLCESTVTIFLNRDGVYSKTVEAHNQRVYRLEDLMAWLEEAGFENMGQFRDLSLDPPEAKCERVHLVARKK